VKPRGPQRILPSRHGKDFVHHKCEHCSEAIPRYTGKGKKRRLTSAGSRFCSRRRRRPLLKNVRLQCLRATGRRALAPTTVVATCAAATFIAATRKIASLVSVLSKLLPWLRAGSSD
jgi:hypothetical protein